MEKSGTIASLRTAAELFASSSDILMAQTGSICKNAADLIELLDARNAQLQREKEEVLRALIRTTST